MYFNNLAASKFFKERYKPTHVMRIVGEIPHPDCRITLFYWNNRYLIKLERARLEQTFKVEEYEVENESDLRSLLSEDFIKESIDRFDAMEQSLHRTLQNHSDGEV